MLQPRVEWCDPFEIPYLLGEGATQLEEGPFTVYFPRSKKAFEGMFIPTPGLWDPSSPEFDPRTCELARGRWTVTSGTIRANQSCTSILARTVERLMKTMVSRMC